MLTIKIKKRIRLNELTIPQRDMLALGNVAVESLKARVGAGRGPTDAPAKPLSKRYARRKIALRKKPIRDLHLTGKMLGAFRVRNVSENKVMAGPGGERSKARFTHAIEPWVGLSPQDRRKVIAAAQDVLIEQKKNLVQVLPG